MELFKRMAGIEFTHVPYRGSAPALTDLISGHDQLVDRAYQDWAIARARRLNDEAF